MRNAPAARQLLPRPVIFLLPTEHQTEILTLVNMLFFLSAMRSLSFFIEVTLFRDTAEKLLIVLS
jgi:hypothetical protein